jgi:hypothetical protein
MRRRDERSASPAQPAAAEALSDGGLAAGATPAVVLALQRSAGNAAVTRHLLLRNGDTPALAPPPGKPPDTSTPPAPTVYADRTAFMAGVTAATVKVEDDWGALQFLNGQSLEEMASIARELVTGHRNAVERLCRGVGGAPAIYNARVRFVLEAALKRGQMGREAFAAQQTAIIVPLTNDDAAGVGKVLDLLGPAVPELEEMKKCKGYLALSADERAQLAFLVGGSTSMSLHAPAAMRKLLDDAKADKDDPATFRKFISGDGHLNYDIRLPGEQRMPRDPYSLSAPSEVADHPYRSGKAKANKVTVEITGKDAAGAVVIHKIDVFEPKDFKPYKKDRVLPSVTEIAEVLAELPVDSRAAIKRVDLHPKRNPDDAYWLAQPGYGAGRKDFVSHMTAGSDGIVDVFPHTANKDVKEIETTMLHESGHVVSNKAWGDDKKDAKWDPWRDAMKKDGVNLSKYGKSSESEDFAEAWALFAPAHGKPRESEVKALIPHRVQLMEGLIKTP